MTRIPFFDILSISSSQWFNALTLSERVLLLNESLHTHANKDSVLIQYDISEKKYHILENYASSKGISEKQMISAMSLDTDKMRQTSNALPEWVLFIEIALSNTQSSGKISERIYNLLQNSFFPFFN